MFFRLTTTGAGTGIGNVLLLTTSSLGVGGGGTAVIGVEGSNFPCLTNPSKNSTESFRRIVLTFSIFSTLGEARIRETSSTLDAVAGRGGAWCAVRGDGDRESDKRSERVYDDSEGLESV